MTKEQIKYMADRFCGWRLPKDFHPDGGIMFMDVYDNGTEQGGKFEPTGTNLFTAQQAEEMIKYLTDGMEEALTNKQDSTGGMPHPFRNPEGVYGSQGTNKQNV